MAGIINALGGIRVLDMSRVLAGPLTGQILGDFGAEVIKIESPHGGDESRTYGPPFFGEQAGIEGGASSFFLGANRNKKSITIDFSKVQGQDLIHQLVVDADVVIENFRPTSLKKYRLDYETLSAINPGLIYCSVTGYGQTGPYSQRPGYDAIFQAMSGLMSSIGYPDEHPSRGPLRTGVSITDVMTALYGAVGISNALHMRTNNQGKGCHIDVSLLDSAIAAMSHYGVHYLMSGQVLPRRGNGGNGGVPSQVFDCVDGQIILTVGNDSQFSRFCNALGVPHLAEDPRFITGPDRIRHRDTLIPMLDNIFKQQEMAVCLALLNEADIPCGPINDMKAVFDDEHVQHRQIKLALGQDSELALINNPIRFSTGQRQEHRRPPGLGEHTDETLKNILGLEQSAIDDLRKQGVL